MMAAGSTLSGLTITTANNGVISVYGVQADGVAGVTIANNTIITESSSSSAFGIHLSGSTAVVSDNIISATRTTGGGGNAIGLFISSSTATVSGNALSAQGGNVQSYLTLQNAMVLSGSTGNVKGAGTCNVNTASASGSTSIGFTDSSTCGP
jgi:hypothetical protein